MSRLICSYTFRRGICREEFFCKEPTDKQTKRNSEKFDTGKRNGITRINVATKYLARVASVSHRVIARRLEREQKNEKVDSFFCSRPNFLDDLARKRLLRMLLNITVLRPFYSQCQNLTPP